MAFNGVVEGYPALAKILGPRNGMAIYRRFAELNARNLLLLQSEIVDLEQEMSLITHLDDTSGDPDRAEYAKSGLKLRRSLGNGQDRQWQKTLEIRGKLKEYSMFCPRNLSQLID
jgi:hypothetical protein